MGRRLRALAFLQRGTQRASQCPRGSPLRSLVQREGRNLDGGCDPGCGLGRQNRGAVHHGWALGEQKWEDVVGSGGHKPVMLL